MIDLMLIAIGLFGFLLMTAAFVMVVRRGGWQQAMQEDAQGRWPLPKRLMVAGASLGCIFGLVGFLSYLLQPLFEPPALREVRRFEGHSSVVSHVAISADGRRLLSTSSGYAEAAGEEDHSIRVWDAATGQELRRLDGPAGVQVHSLAISPDGRRGLAGGPNYIRLWDLDSGEVLQHMEVDQPDDLGKHDVWSVAFSPDGKQGLSGGWDGSVRLWDLTTGHEVPVLRASARQVMSVAFTPDGRRVAAGSGSGWHKNNQEDNFVQVWDLTAGEELHRLKTDQDTATCLAFSPDGQRLLAASRFLAHLCNLNSGEEVQRLKGGWVFQAAAFSPDGQQALCLDSNYEMGLWDVASGKEVARAARLPSNDDRMECAAFAAKGRHAISGHRNKVMRLWESPE